MGDKGGVHHALPGTTCAVCWPPLVVEQVLAMLVGMVDTMMVSSAGEAAVSGVALVDMVNYLIITVMAALTTSSTMVISQYLGRERPERAHFFGRAAAWYGPAVHGHHGPWPGLAAGDLPPVFRRGMKPLSWKPP